MALLGAFRAGCVTLLLSPLLAVGCAGLNAYRAGAEVAQTRYTTIVNFSAEPVDPNRVDALVVEVAGLLGVELDPAVPQPRVVVTTPDQIARLYEPDGDRFAWHLEAWALYFPGASTVMIPYFDRVLLGHELAHYLTEHYMAVPRSQWEEIADAVEWKLAFGAEMAFPTSNSSGARH